MYVVWRFENHQSLYCSQAAFSHSVGTVAKLLQKIDRETDIRTDIVEVTLPIESKDSVRITYAAVIDIYCCYESILL